LPIDPRYPSARLGLMLEHARPALLLTDTATVPTLPGHDVPVLLLDDLDLEAGDPGPVAGEVHPDNALYVMYTSGSTGVPKGVTATHRNVAACLPTQVDAVRMGPGK
ncbi:AMP-binding protein, partial [Streptomyces gilvifuscus]